MDFFATVQAQHHVAHFTVSKVDDIVIDQHAVGRQGKTEVFSGFTFTEARIGNELFDSVIVHQRFAAEKVHFKIMPGAGMLNEKVQCSFADFRAHDRALAVVLALAGKAVGTVEVAGVRNMQAQGFNDVAAAFLEGSGGRRISIRGEELSAVLQHSDFFITAGNIRLGNSRLFPVLFLHGRKNFRPGLPFIQRDHVIGEFVHKMDRSRTDVQHYIIAVQLVLMNHTAPPQGFCIVLRLSGAEHEKCRLAAA